MNELKEKWANIRSWLKQQYALYGIYLIIFVKWAICFTSLSYINRFFPGRAFLQRPIVTIAISLLAGILPWSYISVIAALWLLAQLSALSLEAAAFVFVVLLVLAVLRYLTLPGGGVLLAVIPILFLWRIPFLIPLAVGIAASLSGFVTVGSGVIIYYMLRLIADNLTYFSAGSATLVQRLFFLLRGMAEHKALFVVLACFCLTTLIVYLLSRTEVPYAQQIAVAVGAVFNPCLLLAVFNFLDRAAAPENLLWGSLAALVLGLVFTLLYRFPDFAKTERVQFEDDEYYYYVKAVPKHFQPSEKPRSEPGASRRIKREGAVPEDRIEKEEEEREDA